MKATRLVALALLGLAEGCAPRVREPLPLRPIVVVTIDTLRADHLGCYGYFRDTSPTLDALAGRSVFFRHVVTTIATTLPAHVSLWTSRYPLETGVVSNGSRMRRGQSGASIRFFAELLGAMGYRTAAFVSATPVKKYTGIAVGFESFDEPDVGGRKARETTDAVLGWLERLPAEPFFLWVHYFDPHATYEPPPEHDLFTTEPRLVEFLRAKGVPEPRDPEILSVNNLYDGEIHSVDHHVGRLIARLEELSLFDALTFVVVGDHGEALGQHDRIGHGEIYNEELFVPLIIKFPAESRLDGRVVDSLVSLVDVVPTLVGRLELPVPEADRLRFSGRDALRGRARREHALAQRAFGPPRKWGRGEKFALVALDWKYLLETRRPDELYHLVEDPGERTNLVERERERAGRLRRQLLEEVAERTRRADRLETVEETSPKVVEELRSLGYIQ